MKVIEVIDGKVIDEGNPDQIPDPEHGLILTIS